MDGGQVEGGDMCGGGTGYDVEVALVISLVKKAVGAVPTVVISLT